MFVHGYLKLLRGFWLGLFIVLSAAPSFAAQVYNLHQQSLSSLSTMFSVNNKQAVKLRELGRSRDFNHKLHLRLQQTYLDYPVWGAEVMMHFSDPNPEAEKLFWHGLWNTKTKGSMNGFIYQGLDLDLQALPSAIFTEAKAEQTWRQALVFYQQQGGKALTLLNKQISPMVYVDQNQKAHWVYFISFKTKPLQGFPERPCYLMDAMTFEVYQAWNNIQTREPWIDTYAGGLGGNIKMGQWIYDGLTGDYPALFIQRNKENHYCYLENKEVVVKDARRDDMIERFACTASDSKHNNLFWDGSLDAVNGAYSPSNDALFVGSIIKQMYQQWYGLAVLEKKGKPMTLVMRVHEDMENAYWDGEQMTFGDGGSMFYPLVSLGVAAHEISHGFTEQHSNLVYEGQSGGLNESFSDMAAKAAEFYVDGKNSWQIGAEIVKESNQALRYMDHPVRDCKGRIPGQECSIEKLSDYSKNIDVHYSSGIFNRVFYLLSTSPAWDTKKAFDVMVQANSYYWTPSIGFRDAACAVMDAVKDYGYPEQAAALAFAKVGIDTRQC